VTAAHVANSILLDHLTCEVLREEADIVRTDRNIPIGNNCTYDELYIGMPAGSGDYEDGGDESNQRDAVPTTSWRRRPAPELERFDHRTRNVDSNEGEDGPDADANVDEQQDASHANGGSMQNVGH